MPDYPFRRLGLSLSSQTDGSEAAPRDAQPAHPSRPRWLHNLLEPHRGTRGGCAASANTLPSILVIEDDGDIARGLAFMLSGGYTVRTADRGALALDLAAEKRPDLLLVDFRLPDTNGIELISQLREVGVGSRAIMISAYENQREASLAAGFDTFLLKPWENGELVWQIEHALARPI